eukprot:4830540-Prymnesium_polylepis.1
MSDDAADATRAVLCEVGQIDMPSLAYLPWSDYFWSLRPYLGAADGAEGAAASYDVAARQEAAVRLIMNHAKVLNDVTNPEPKTQLELVRIDVTCMPYVAQALRETCRRLLGSREGLAEMQEVLDMSNDEQ